MFYETYYLINALICFNDIIRMLNLKEQFLRHKTTQFYVCNKYKWVLIK